VLDDFFANRRIACATSGDGQLGYRRPKLPPVLEALMAGSAACGARIETGVLVLETVAKIRREHFARGKGVKTIAREIGLARNTLRKPPV